MTDDTGLEEDRDICYNLSVPNRNLAARPLYLAVGGMGHKGAETYEHYESNRHGTEKVGYVSGQ